jgi:hypothetical protein
MADNFTSKLTSQNIQTAWTNNCGVLKEEYQDSQLHQFVIMSYSHLSDEILSQEKEYSKTLYALLNAPNEKQCQTLLKSILISNIRIPEFAARITQLSSNKD